MVQDEDRLNEVWLRYREKILKALTYTAGAYSEGDVFASIRKGQMRLWERDGALAITEVVRYPNCLAVKACYAAGKLEPLLELEADLLPLFQEIGCTKVVLIGRKGWVRALKDRGFRAVSYNYVKDI